MEILSEFGRMAAAIDSAETLIENRRGGPTRVMLAHIVELERRLVASRPERRADFSWLARRLARAHENGWGDESIAPLVRMSAP